MNQSKSYVTSVAGAVTLLAVLMLGGCERESRGFALPPGDAAQGQVEFVALGCNHCHRIEGSVERAADSAYPNLDVRLGGRVSRIKTYGELVTAIIHPARDLSRGDTPALVTEDGLSRMPVYNDSMTVSQLVDITTFLQQTYVLYVPEYHPIFMP
ncbi:MAG: hypothetical protein AB8B93_00920 [Pseudomonadales bacterium]